MNNPVATRRWKQKALAEGRCTQCGKPRNLGVNLCDGCLTKQRDRGAKWRVEQPLDYQWKTFNTTLNRYGLTLDQYHSLQERQDFCCAICEDEIVLEVDHDHQTNRVRGLLCHKCNVVLCKARDRTDILLNAVQYLERAA